MASFLTHAGLGELLSLAHRGTLSDGSACSGFEVLLVAPETYVWPSSAVGAILNDLPLANYSRGFLPRAAGSWSMGSGPQGEALANLTAPIVLQANASLEFAAVALTLGTSPSSTILAVSQCGYQAASPGQRITVESVALGLGPAALAGSGAFTTAHGARLVLSLALRGTMPDGSGALSAWSVGLLDAAFTSPGYAAGWAYGRGDVAPHLVESALLSPPPAIARTPAGWSIVRDDPAGLSIAKPAAPLAFAYTGATAVEVGACALFDSPLGELCVVTPFTATHSLPPSSTVRLVVP